MLMKDSGMRIGEVLQLKKKDFDMTKTPIEIHIPSFATKTKKSRITFVTRETRPILQRRLNQLNPDELVFGTNDNIRTSVNTEISKFDYIRNKIGNTCPRFLEKYDSNDRYKISLHSLRSFTATQCAEAVDESFAHGIIGHKKYLGQYIRNQDKLAEKYLKSESYLMVYEKEVVVEHDEEINNIQAQLNKQGRLIQELLAITDEKTLLLKQNSELQKRMNELETKIRS